MGRPQGANIRGLLGGDGHTHRSSAPPEGTDANLWCRYSIDTDWAWTNMGRPQGANITSLVSVVSVMDTPSSPQRARLFVTAAMATSGVVGR